MFSLRKKKNDKFVVRKKSLFRKKDKLDYILLISIALFFSVRYILWWFNPSHIPNNWIGSLHTFDYFIFGVLSLVVFIGLILRFGIWFALWFASKPIHVEPEKGLKVALLTCFVPGKEPIEMLEKTLKAMKAVRYPHDSWVLDEGNDRGVKELSKKLGVKYFTRNGISKYNLEEGLFRAKTKAGNHNAWIDKYDHKYHIVAQIDMDHIPEPNYFERTLGYFKDPKVGFVGMPQIYKNIQNWIAKGAAEQAYFFHGPMQQGFYGSDMPFLIGTSHIYRTKAMKDIGGYAPTIVEDHLTGMKFFSKKWKGVFVPEILAKGEGPLNWVDYFNQQMRWSYGLFEIIFKHTPFLIWKLNWRQKINYFVAQLYYFTGVAVILGFILISIYLIFGIRAASMNFMEWIIYSVPVLLTVLIIHIYFHKFNIDPEKEPYFGLTGMFLNLGANIIYTLAFLKFVKRSKLKYMVTQKGIAGARQLVSIRNFTWHLIFAVILLFSLIYSFYAGNSAIQLRLWALFSVLTLLAVSFSTYFEGLILIPRIRKNLQYVKYTSFAVLFIAVMTGSLVYISSSKVQAIFSTNAMTAPMAGKVEAPKRGAFIGISIYQKNELTDVYNIQAKEEVKFGVIGYYQAWGVENNKFDKTFAREISENGSVPMITWEPWRPIGGFDRSEDIVDQRDYRLSEINKGKYDYYIEQYAKDIRDYKGPVMIRFAHEMNGNWYPWGSTFNESREYIAAWRRIHDIFEANGATNVTWVWSPNEIYLNPKVPNAGNILLFYPGDGYVDYVGFSSFNWADNYNQTIWMAPEDLFSSTLEELRKINKPILITETAGAPSVNDVTSKSRWITALADYLEENPEIKGAVWFNAEDNGIDWTITESESSSAAFKKAFSKPLFRQN